MARKPVRSPFVVIVAVLASAAACGGQLSPDPNAASDAGGDTEIRPDGDIPLAKTCPTERPSTGSACRIEPTVSCYFGTCAAGSSYPVTLQCEGATSTWKETVGVSCNPPPVCPPVPYEGAPCKPGFGTCLYPDTCDARPKDAPASRSWICAGDRLTRRDITTDYTVACPVAAPRNGDPCTCAGHYTGPCSYGDCYGTPTTTARCDERTNTWSVGISSCNPPPPDAG